MGEKGITGPEGEAGMKGNKVSTYPYCLYVYVHPVRRMLTACILPLCRGVKVLEEKLASKVMKESRDQ